MDDKATALFWVNPANHRYYAVDLQQDLLADWILIRTNGKLGTRLGQVKQRVCKNYLEGLNLIEGIKKKRRKRGYLLLSCSISFGIIPPIAG